jgi:hypothetical protein
MALETFRPRLPRKGGNKILFLEIKKPNVSVLTLSLSQDGKTLLSRSFDISFAPRLKIGTEWHWPKARHKAGITPKHTVVTFSSRAQFSLKAKTNRTLPEARPYDHSTPA